MSTGRFYYSNHAMSPVLSAAHRRLLLEYGGKWGFLQLASVMEPVCLQGLNEVALLNRLETKYVLREEDLLRAFSTLTDCYRVLDIDGIRLHRYMSLYFDTAAFDLYKQHHAGGKHRYKIRSREYTDTRLAFLEVKHKISQIRTVKSRIQTPEFMTYLSSEYDGFIEENYPLSSVGLEPKLLNAYHRITLVGRYTPERVTFDLNPWFYTNFGERTLPGIAIAEVKYGSANRNSAFMLRMREMGIRPMSFSKYCVGVSMLYSQVKSNRFKPTLRSVDKIIRGG